MIDRDDSDIKLIDYGTTCVCKKTGWGRGRGERHKQTTEFGYEMWQTEHVRFSTFVPTKISPKNGYFHYWNLKRLRWRVPISLGSSSMSRPRTSSEREFLLKQNQKQSNKIALFYLRRVVRHFGNLPATHRTALRRKSHNWRAEKKPQTFRSCKSPVNSAAEIMKCRPKRIRNVIRINS